MLSRITRLYRAEIELFWKWRLGRWALIKRGLIALLAAVLAIKTKPFLVHPAEWEMDLAPLLGAPMVYQQLRRWMEGELGMEFGATKRDPETGTSGGGAAE